ncbi:TetR/AcrR family transcriptional regulator [Cohnella lubricantis]|uniref:TetR/AcrR family transcriptional regulator n=1 Tax=Cohnella lubricantis TaxID=2163172 RepID=A0A841TCD8_9BACL|nr:TetR/AcrR family transcriptional regulator [Cohnella lubricantis]MBB6676657.1 TetR/AcrR family transcriptional regulator [Cohnella lubricantis]MBP2120425.1 AcrR family transcriptional regulator [Cohnella lubricantis]
MNEQLEPLLEELLKASSDGKRMTEKQARIIRAAIEMFAEKGYAASSTSEIAQRAGVAEGTIFRHYKTKKDLLLAIATPALGRLIAPFVIREFRGVLNTQYESYDQFLRALIENRISFVQQYWNLIRIIIQELPFHPDLQTMISSAVLPQVLVRIEPILNKFKSEGKLLDLPNFTIVRLTISSLGGYIVGHLLAESGRAESWDDVQEREATIAFLMRGLTRN